MSTRDITLRWDDPNLIEKGYKVYRSKTPMDINNMPPPIASLDKNSTEYIDVGQTIGDTNYYRVSACIDDLEQFSPEVVLTIYNYSDVYIGTTGGYIEKVNSSLPEVEWSYRGAYSDNIIQIDIDQVSNIVTAYDNGRIAHYSGNHEATYTNIEYIDMPIYKVAYRGTNAAVTSRRYTEIFDRYLGETYLRITNSESSHGIYIDQENNTYFTINNELVKYDKTGNILWSRPRANSTFGITYDITEMDNAIFYIHSTNIKSYSKNGDTHIADIDTGNSNIFLKTDSKYLYAIAGNGIITKIDSTGNIVNVLDLNMNITDIEIDNAGYFYVINNNNLKLLGTTGEVIWSLVSSSGNDISSISINDTQSQSTLYIPYNQLEQPTAISTNEGFVVDDVYEVLIKPYGDTQSVAVNPTTYSNNTNVVYEALIKPYGDTQSVVVNPTTYSNNTTIL